MKTITSALLILSLIGPSVSFADPAESRAQLELVRGEERIRGFGRGRGKRFHFGKRRPWFHRGDLTNRFYYGYPRYFYRNYGGIRKFYPRKDRSYYPNQGGSDYRDWFDFPRR